MVARTCILMAVLAFLIVYTGALFRGHSMTTIWLDALIAMVIFAIIGFFLGWAYEALIKETMIQEESLIFSEYLKKHPESGGDQSLHKQGMASGMMEEEEERESAEDQEMADNEDIEAEK